MKLPIDPIIPEAIRLLAETARCLVLQASPGSGKTTRLPPALLKAPFRGSEGEILVLEPRRLAAKYAAIFVAQELNETVGKTVGYQFRFENVSSPQTRLRYLTEGMLMRRLLSDPSLKNVAAVVLDEFHERHLHGDIALAFLRRLQTTTRPDLRIVVMSATLDTEALSRFLSDCPVLKVDSPNYPVKIGHLPAPPAKPLELVVREAILQARTEGDVLVFLPGMAEIRRCQEKLQGMSNLLVLPLHGELSKEEQDRAMRRAEKRKVILATNVAETSLTIPGITVVIDSGLHRQASHSWWSGVPSLRTRPISRASAIQRAGRAGRTAPGECLRLYTLGDFNSRPPFEKPEIQRADLAQTVLELKALGIDDFSNFRWFETPGAAADEAAHSLLYKLGAINAPGPRSSITALGKRMAQIPAHPRIARLLIESEKQQVLQPAATLAALMGEGGLESLDALDEAFRASLAPHLSRARSHLLSSFSSSGAVSGEKAQTRLAQSLLSAFPDRVARKRKLGSSASNDKLEIVFAAGGSGFLQETPLVVENEIFIVLDVQEQQHLNQARSQLRIRSLCPIQPEWLFDVTPPLIRESRELRWDKERQEVCVSDRILYDEMILDETKGKPGPEDSQAAALLMIRSLLGVDVNQVHRAEDWLEAFRHSGIADPELPELIETALGRIQLVRKFRPDLLKEFSESDGFSAIFERLFQGRVKRDELEQIDWGWEILTGAAPGSEHEIEKQAPLQLQLPSGRRVRIHYPLDQPPWIESRLQDFFGMKQGPAILGGKVPLTLHLLAPNQRPVQVTTDLAGFWERGYAELRKSLSRRYPKHAWPEDPLL